VTSAAPTAPAAVQSVPGTVSDRAWPARIIAIGALLGLVYGMIEGGLTAILLFVPGALSWSGGNTRDTLWAAPAVYVVVGTVVSIPFALLSLVAKRIPWDVVLVALYAALGTVFALRVRGGAWAAWYGALILAAGVAVTVVRLYRPRRDRWSRRALRLLPITVLVAPALACAVVGAKRLRERRQLAALPAPAPAAVNVLLLVIDTQRADHLGAYGYQRNTSPGIDRLAKQSLFFENAFAAASWTLPSHASMFTGRPLHEHRAGMIARKFLDGKFPTIAEAMSEKGYLTGASVANTYFAGRQTGLNRGFIRYEDFYGTAGDALGRTVLGNLLTWNILPKLGSVDLLGRKTGATVNREILSIVSAAGDRPFFIFANYFDVHRPVLPPKPFAGRFSKGPDATDDEGAGQVQFGWLDGDVRVPSEARLKRMRDTYDDGVAYVDSQIDSLLAALDRRGVLQNTAVIITSDHGESWGEHGLMFHGHSLYMDQIHIPLLIYYPRRLPAARVSHAASLEQLPATILDLGGVKDARFPGTSLVRIVDSASRRVYSEVARNSAQRFNWPSSRTALGAALTDRWHFISPLLGAAELYDLHQDRAELTNLADSAGYRAVVDSLRASLDAFGLPTLKGTR
jgi:arylsulfatase A-like enzyme